MSGGLLLHKSTHNFDVINWWLDGIPAEVFAMGGLVFYGKENATARREEARTKYERYAGMAEAKGDPFRLVVDENDTMKALYHDAENESGYIRDRNVFREEINIEDTMSLLIRYRMGEVVSYSLIAFCPDEGFRASLCGDGGRIDYVEKHGSHITGEREIPTTGEEQYMRLRVQKHFSEAVEMVIPMVAGAHGGGDALIQEQMFATNPPADVLKRNAGHEQGAASVLIGAAANISMQSVGW